MNRLSGTYILPRKSFNVRPESITETYYDIFRLNKQTAGLQSFSTMHINARSVRTKVDEIDNLMASMENKFDVGFIETSLSQIEHIPFFDGYRSQHLTRINQRGGGGKKKCVLR